jgi:transcriptional regulator with XRE-family HTH domain
MSTARKGKPASANPRKRAGYLPVLSIRERIRDARLAAELSCAELARRVGVRASAAVQWESRHGTTPSVGNMARVAAATGVAFEWLATGRGPRDIDKGTDAPAVVLADFAQNGFEERMLRVARQVPLRRRDALLKFLEETYRV